MCEPEEPDEELDHLERRERELELSHEELLNVWFEPLGGLEATRKFEKAQQLDQPQCLEATAVSIVKCPPDQIKGEDRNKVNDEPSGLQVVQDNESAAADPLTPNLEGTLVCVREAVVSDGG